MKIIAIPTNIKVLMILLIRKSTTVYLPPHMTDRGLRIRNTQEDVHRSAPRRLDDFPADSSVLGGHLGWPDGNHRPQGHKKYDRVEEHSEIVETMEFSINHVWPICALVMRRSDYYMIYVCI